MKKKYLLSLIFVFILTASLMAETNYYYNSGDPTVLSNWGNIPGGTGTHPVSFSELANYNIETGKTAIVNNSWTFNTLPYLKVKYGATLIANSPVTFISFAAFQVENGGTYIHNNTADPASTIFGGLEFFEPTSTVIIKNWIDTSTPVTSGLLDNPNGYYYANLEIDWAGCTGNWFQGFNNINIATKFCSNSLRLTNTGTGRFILGKDNGTGCEVIVKNYYQSGGILDLSFGTEASHLGSARIIVNNKFEKTGGTIDASSPHAYGSIYFKKEVYEDTTFQTFYNSGEIKNIKFELGFAKLRLLSDMYVGVNTFSPTGFNADVSTIDFGAYQIKGPALVLFINSVKLKIRSAGGINSGNLTGNVISTGGIYIGASDTVEYCGTTPQVFGDSLPTFPCKLVINNPAGVSLSKHTRFTSPIQFINGKINTGNFDFTGGLISITGISSSSFININGTGSYKIFIANVGDYYYPVGNGTFNPVRLQFSAVTPDTFAVNVGTGFTAAALPYDTAYCVRKTWSVVESTPGGSAARVYLQWSKEIDQAVNFNSSNTQYINRWNTASLRFIPMLTSVTSGFYSGAPYTDQCAGTPASPLLTTFNPGEVFTISTRDGVFNQFFYTAGDPSMLSSWKEHSDGAGSSPLLFDDYTIYKIGQDKNAIFNSSFTFTDKTFLQVNGNGQLTSNAPVTNSGSIQFSDSSVYNHNNTGVAASTIFAGEESFSPKSTFNITMWSDTAQKLYSGITGGQYFGNLTINFSNLLCIGSAQWKNHGINSTLCLGNLKYIQSSGFNFAPVGNWNTIPTVYIGGNLQIGDSLSTSGYPVLDLAGGTTNAQSSTAGILNITGNIDIQGGGITSQSFPFVGIGRISMNNGRKHSFYSYTPFLWQTSNIGNATYPNIIGVNDTLLLKSDMYNSQSQAFLLKDVWKIDGVLDCDIYSIRSLSLQVSATGKIITRKAEGFRADLSNVQSITLDPASKFEYAGTQPQNFLAADSYKLTSIPNLVINNPYGVTMNTDNITVENNLNLKSGRVISDAVNYLTIPPSCSVTSLSGTCLSGPVKLITNSISTRTIPLGRGNVFRNFVFTGGNNNYTEWMVNYFNTPQNFGTAMAPEIMNVSQFEYYTLDRVFGSAPGYAQLEWGHNSGVTNPANIRIVRWNGSMWVETGILEYSGTNDSGYVVSNEMQSFGPLAIASTDDQRLPVEMSSFNASSEKNNVKLNWETVHEANNSGFNIERKSNADTNWKKIIFVQGSGNTNTPSGYSYDDRNLSTGKYKYRLKQMDFNGNFEYFNLQNEISVGVPNKFSLSQNYPNPFNPTTKINFDIPADAKVSLQVYDMTGRLITTLLNNESYTAGYYTVPFNANQLASGTYFYRIAAGDFTQTKKMQLVK